MAEPCDVSAAYEPTNNGPGQVLVQLSRQSHRPVATLEFGLGTRHNVMATESWIRLGEAIAAFPWDDDLRAIVIRGRGGSFCAGSDINEWQRATLATVNFSFEAMERAFRLVEAIPIPSVAQISGVALGAGFQLALACDLRVCTPDTQLGMPIARFGIHASSNFARRIVAQTSPSVAYDLLYTGRLVNGAEAHRIGLVSTLVPTAKLESGTDILLDAIAELPANALRAAKLAVKAASMGWPEVTASGATSTDSVDLNQLHTAIDLFNVRRQ
jgi:enoyl-CoA hydratase/carnithine racemase